jgi:hypothetical protein
VGREAIDLDHRRGLIAVEIGDVPPERVLSSELETIELSSAEARPEDALGHGHPLAKVASASDGDGLGAKRPAERPTALRRIGTHEAA